MSSNESVGGSGPSISVPGETGDKAVGSESAWGMYHFASTFRQMSALHMRLFQEFLRPTFCASKCMSGGGVESKRSVRVRDLSAIKQPNERGRKRSKESLIDTFVRTVARNCIFARSDFV